MGGGVRGIKISFWWGGADFGACSKKIWMIRYAQFSEKNKNGESKFDDFAKNPDQIHCKLWSLNSNFTISNIT